jgi:hypothetical protein
MSLLKEEKESTLKAQEILKQRLLNNLLCQSLLQVSAIQLKQQVKFLKPSISSFSFQLHFSRAQAAIRELFQPKCSQQLNALEEKRAKQVHSLSQSAQLQLQRNIISKHMLFKFFKTSIQGGAPPSDQKKFRAKSKSIYFDNIYIIRTRVFC